MAKYEKKLLDAEAMRMLQNTLKRDPICDFCGDSSPLYVYAATRRSDGIFINCWRWCCCWSCDNYILHEEWDEIVAKMIRKVRSLVPDMPILPLHRAVHMALNDFFIYAIRIKGPGD